MAKMTKEAAHELLRNRKVYVNGKSAEIQRKLFMAGYEWPVVGKSVINEDCPFIYTTPANYLSSGDDMVNFSEDENIEISAEEILAIEIEPECPFKPFDRVLMRDSNSEIWTACLFSHYRERDFAPYYAAGGSTWAQCIPFEGNENLVGTTNEPKK